MSKRTITITLIDEEDDNETELELPAKNEVCSRCEGYGTHDHPDIGGNGITASEWGEWDQDDRETYLNGGYDVTCEECNGAKVVQVPDEEACDAEQLKALQRWNDQQEADAAYDAQCAHERRMGY